MGDKNMHVEKVSLFCFLLRFRGIVSALFYTFLYVLGESFPHFPYIFTFSGYGARTFLHFSYGS